MRATRHASVRPVLLALLILLLPGIAATASARQEDPDCAPGASKPATACPVDAATARYIVWVESTDIGARIFLTEEGVALGRSCEGAAELVELASDLYADIPAEHRLRHDLRWADPALTREVFAHAWAATMGIDNGNPVDIVFGDYVGDPEGFQSEVYRGGSLALLCPGPPPPAT